MKHRVQYIKKRDGKKVKFEVERIKDAIKKAFISNNISNESVFDDLTHQVLEIIERHYPIAENKTNENDDKIPSVENIQDIVENTLLINNYTEIAKSYIVYREQHKELRQKKALNAIREHKLTIIKEDNTKEPLDPEAILKKIEKVSAGLDKIHVKGIIDEVCRTAYNEMPVAELQNALINAVKTNIEKHYNYSYLASRLILDKIYRKILSVPEYSEKLEQKYKTNFADYIDQGIKLNMLNPALKDFNLTKISQAIVPSRDKSFLYLGMQTLYDRYLLRTRSRKKEVFELPQWMWMRIAMGLALKEENKEEKAIEFYSALSQFYVMCSTPTLFNSGTTRSQMSSCFVNTVEDSLEGIFKIYADNAQLCKWAGAVGTDWTPVRAKGATIKGTNGPSQGIIPFIKIFNDVALAVNQGGKRKGALAAYLEMWHRDIEEFMELKKNTGDERRRAHDIHTAVWIPDLFMKRVREKGGEWTLFSPDAVPDLHDLYGKKFEARYAEYEKQGIPGSKKVNALDLWRKTLTMLFETGHPWITFKDPCNIRSPQDHVGVVHASNLCTEITINSSADETAVCNLASINMSKLVSKENPEQINKELMEKVVTTAVRMLNNVVDINFYTIPETKNANLKHRPVGLGMMGYHDALFKLKIDFDSDENLEFADRSMEMVSYYALLASSKLAKEFSPYKSYKGSKWDRGILPLDTLDLLEQERGIKIKVNRTTRLDWSIVRDHIKEHGMRNSNVMAIAPTATIANITGVIPCVEPIFKNIYMKENMSGNFVVINKYLIDELYKLGLWNKKILTKIKAYNGSVLNIDEIPADIRRRFKEVFEIDPMRMIQTAALRSKWIDQAASTNLFFKTTSGKAISDAYMMAWEYGLKTTYYLRTLAASQVTKTVAVELPIKSRDALSKEVQEPVQEVTVCSILDPDCETCQ